MNLLLLLIVLMFTITFSLLIVGLVTVKRGRVHSRLKKLTVVKNKEQAPVSLDEEELEKSFFERMIKPVIQKIASGFSQGKNHESSAYQDRLLSQLIMAGNPGNLQPNEFMVLQFLISLSLLFIVLMLCLFIQLNPPILILVFASSGFTFGFVVPKFWLSKQVTKRKSLISRTLPNTLDLLQVSMEAGLGFDLSLSKVVEKTKGPLALEFKKALEEIVMGKSRREALKDIGKRVGVEDLQLFINNIIQAEQLGVGIAKVIQIQAEQLRTLRRQRTEEQAMKVPVKMLFPLIFFIFPTILLIVLGPVMLKIMHELGATTLKFSF
ncbi:MAG: type II secretion system F family protein [bacterium]|nr:type II secretion system F family protein [bacterium]